MWKSEEVRRYKKKEAKADEKKRCRRTETESFCRQADALKYDDFAGLEEFTVRWSCLLHPNNAILVGIKYYLIQFYGSAPGFQLDQMATPLLRRKIQLCRDLLAIAHVLEPGSSKLRGLLLLLLLLLHLLLFDRIGLLCWALFGFIRPELTRFDF